MGPEGTDRPDRGTVPLASAPAGRDRAPMRALDASERLMDDFCARTGLPASALDAALARARVLGLVEDDGAGTRPGPYRRVVPTARGFDFLSDLQALFLPG